MTSLLRRPRHVLRKSRLISMKVPEPLLAAFKSRCRVEGERYQTKIKALMAAWIQGDSR